MGCSTSDRKELLCGTGITALRLRIKYGILVLWRDYIDPHTYTGGGGEVLKPLLKLGSYLAVSKNVLTV